MTEKAVRERNLGQGSALFLPKCHLLKKHHASRGSEDENVCQLSNVFLSRVQL